MYQQDTTQGKDGSAREARLAPSPVMPGAILCTIAQAAGMTGRGHTWVYEALADGRLKGVKSDRRTLIVVASIHEYVATLPPACIKPMYRPLSPKAKRKRQQKAQAES